MKTLGMDLAAQPKETAACVLRWEPDGAIVESLTAGLDDHALLASIEQCAPEKSVATLLARLPLLADRPDLAPDPPRGVLL